MKKIALIILLMLIMSNCLAAEIIIPFSVYPKQLQKSFADRGYKLDLNGNDRTPDSWGFIENRGTEFKLFTYAPVTQEDFAIIKEIVFSTVKYTLE
jgi:hypothetical protein